MNVQLQHNLENVGMIFDDLEMLRKAARYLHSKAGHEIALPLFCGVPKLDTRPARTLAKFEEP
jgi:hypothetical protein